MRGQRRESRLTTTETKVGAKKGLHPIRNSPVVGSARNSIFLMLCFSYPRRNFPRARISPPPLSAISSIASNCAPACSRLGGAPYPSSYCKAQAKAQIEALAARGAIDVSRLVKHGHEIELPLQQLRVAVHNASGATGFAQITDSAVAWTCAAEERDELASSHVGTSVGENMLSGCVGKVARRNHPGVRDLPGRGVGCRRHHTLRQP
jgi:hypothetical protein